MNQFTNRSMPDCTIIPVLVYEDVDAAIAWLCQTFGFTERWRVGNHRAQLAFGNGGIALSGQTAARNEDRHSIMVRVMDVNSHYERVKQQGANILGAPADFPYGERQYSVTDLEGHHWTFSQSIADVAPEDWGGVTPAR